MASALTRYYSYVGSINRTGCVLAWCLVNAEAVSRVHGNANLAAMWFTSGVQLQDCPKRQPFPMSEGELSGLVDLLQKVAINEVVASSFTELTGASSVGAWLASMG